MKLRWNHAARQDLDEIAAFIAQDSPQAAARWIAHLIRRARRAVEFPTWGREVPEVDRGDVREIIESNYRIIYQILDEQDAVEVVMVMESHRRFPDIDHLLKERQAEEGSRGSA